MSEWPPRFRINDRGVATLFLLKYAGGAVSTDAVDHLEEILKASYQRGYEDGKAETTND